MPIKTVMILGASGRLGRALLKRRPDVEVVAFTHAELDVSDEREVRSALALLRPDVVVNAAAWTDVTGAQTHEAAARNVNAEAPAMLGRLLARLDVPLVHYSTDYVFSGEGDAPWTEASIPVPRPLGVYGLTKREGEVRLLESGAAGCIIRAGWLHSGERDFVSAILNAAVAGRPLSVTCAQIGTPASTDALARWTWAALPVLTRRDRCRIVHYAEAGGFVTRAEMAFFLLIDAEMRAVAADESSLAARFRAARDTMATPWIDDGIRPLNCRLQCLEKALFPATEDWRTGVSASVGRFLRNGKSCG